MLTDINIKCTDIGQLLVMLRMTGGRVELPSAKLPQGEDERLGPGDYAVEVTLEHGQPGATVICEITSGGRPVRTCQWVVPSNGEIVARCAFFITAAGKIG